MTLLTYLFIIVFLVGLYFYAKCADPNYIEALTNSTASEPNSAPRCPNLLIQKGSKFYLYNSKLAKVPGVNPIEFDNLEDYTEFLEWQKAQGIRCPVLYLQQSFNAQGEPCYTARPGVSDLQGGLPPCKPQYPNPILLYDATRNDPPYNKNSYPAFDQSSQYVGTTTPLDGMNYKAENSGVSPNPMDDNWGGAAYTQSLVDKGYYADNEVDIYIP
jgi:hypothetical protein